MASPVRFTERLLVLPNDKKHTIQYAVNPDRYWVEPPGGIL